MLACLSNDAETEAVDFTRLEDEEAQIERILIEGLRLKQEVNRLSRILEDSESVKDELMHDNKSLKDALMNLEMNFTGETIRLSLRVIWVSINKRNLSALV